MRSKPQRHQNSVIELYKLQFDQIVRWCHVYKMTTLATCSTHFLFIQTYRLSSRRTRMSEARPSSRFVLQLTLRTSLYYYYPPKSNLLQATLISLRWAIYHKEHLFHIKQSVARPCSINRFPPRYTQRGRSTLCETDVHSLLCEP